MQGFRSSSNWSKHLQMVGHLVNQVYIKFRNPATEVSRFRAAQDSLPFEGPREETPSRLSCCTWCSWEWRKSLGRVYGTKFDHVYQAWRLFQPWRILHLYDGRNKRGKTYLTSKCVFPPPCLFLAHSLLCFLSFGGKVGFSLSNGLWVSSPLEAFPSF